MANDRKQVEDAWNEEKKRSPSGLVGKIDQLSTDVLRLLADRAWVAARMEQVTKSLWLILASYAALLCLLLLFPPCARVVRGGQSFVGHLSIFGLIEHNETAGTLPYFIDFKVLFLEAVVGAVIAAAIALYIYARQPKYRW